MPPRDAPVDDCCRFDLYLSAAADGHILPPARSAPATHPAIDVGQLASDVFKEVEDRAQRCGRRPSMYYAKRLVQGTYDETVDATLQTRGGGIVLFLLSVYFFPLRILHR